MGSSISETHSTVGARLFLTVTVSPTVGTDVALLGAGRRTPSAAFLCRGAKYNERPAGPLLAID
jgi:hypothetical protein